MPTITPVAAVNWNGIFRIAPFVRGQQEILQKSRRLRRLKRLRHEQEEEAEERVKRYLPVRFPLTMRTGAGGRFTYGPDRFGRVRRRRRYGTGSVIDVRR